MAEPHWTSYVGMATGIIGALTGLTGAILSIVSYRRTSRVKELELRLELRKAASTAAVALSDLKELLPRVNQSHLRVASAVGKMRSGEMEIWKKTYAEDENRLNQLLDSMQPFAGDFLDLELAGLESKLTDLHELVPQIRRLTDKYEGVLARDNAERDRIRTSHSESLSRRGGSQ